MKAFIEDYGLNLLGDTLAGFLGLATLLVVLFTYFAQKAQAEQNLKEIKQQNVIAKATAKANYKFSLFDKRLHVYDEFNELIMQVVVGQMEEQFHSRALRAINAARNLFHGDGEISQWLAAVQISTQQHRTCQGEITRLTANQGTPNETHLDANKLLEENNKLIQLYLNLSDYYDWNKLDLLLHPYLRLSSDIKLEADNETATNQRTA